MLPGKIKQVREKALAPRDNIASLFNTDIKRPICSCLLHFAFWAHVYKVQFLGKPTAKAQQSKASAAPLSLPLALTRIYYLNELFHVDFTRSICAHIFERGTDFVVIVAVASLLAGLLDFLLVEIAILIQVNLTVQRAV